MSNFVGYVDKIRHDDLSERANNFINENLDVWQKFIFKFHKAAKFKMQVILDEGIAILKPSLDKYNPTVDEWDGESPLEGELIWNDLWEWLVKNNTK